MSRYRNIMQFIEFQKQFLPHLIFSLLDIQKVYPNFSYRQLDRWEKKEYLLKIKQGYYTLSGKDLNRNFLYYVANRIYSPSYISLEMALSFYNLIPEEVFQITSVSTKKTNNFNTPLGNFNYRHIKPSIYFGYKLLDYEKKHNVIIAEPEKALLDYLYLNTQLRLDDDFKEIRINRTEFVDQINLEKFNTYLDAFENKSLVKRTKIFLNVILND